MGALVNLVKVNVATTGTGTVTLGTAVSGFLTMAQAGAQSGIHYSYAISDGTNSEIGIGLYNSAGPTMTRTVLNSTNNNALLNLSGSAVLFITPNSADISQLGIIQMMRAGAFTQ